MKMDNLRNCSIFLALLCTFLISDISPSPLHKKSIKEQGNGDVQRKYYRRSVNPIIEDEPIKQNIDNLQVKLYAQKGIEKLAETSTGSNDPILEKILAATFFPPAGKLIYEIKIKVGRKQIKNDGQECKVNVWRESDTEPSVTVQCDEIGRKKRGTDEAESQIADLPTKLSTNDPQVKKYAQKAVDQFGSPFAQDKKVIVKEIKEATFYPPPSKLLYKIKFQMGMTNCAKGSDKPKCEYNSEAGYENCAIDVFRETDKEPSIIIECFRIARRRRDAGETRPQIADFPTDLKIDDPKVKKYAQMAVDQIGGHSSGKKGIVREIVEAKSYPSSSKLLYTVKLKMGSTKCPKESDEKNCEYDPEAGDDNCEISVFKETDEEDSRRFKIKEGVQCWRVDRRRRAVDSVPEIADLPPKLSVDDPQVKLYAQRGIEKLAETSTSPSDPVLEKILEATFFPPAGKLVYEIKIKVGSERNKDDSQECKVNVWRESDAEPSIAVECDQARRRRRTAQPQIMDLPSKSPLNPAHYIADLPGKLSVDNPEVKKYAQQGLEEYAQNSPTAEVVLVQIIEAHYVPLSIYSHQVKVKFGKRTCMKDEKKDCEKDEIETEICTIYIPNDFEKTSIDIKCSEDEKK